MKRTPVSAPAAVLMILLASCSTAPKQPDRATEVKDRAAEATQFGNAYYRQGRYDLAMQFFTQALESNLSVDNETGVIQSYNSIGRVYLAMGRVDDAETSFLKALAIADPLGGEPLFVTTNNLGELYLRRGDARTALETFRRVLAGPVAGISAAETGLLSHNLGSAYKATGDLARAMEWLQKSLAINLGGRLYEEAAADYYMIASVYSKQGDHENARRHAELALEYDKRIENSLGIVKDLAALGLIASRAGDAETAYGFFQRSYLAATALRSTADTRAALEGLIATGETIGRTAEVAAHRKALADLSAP